MNCLKSVLSLLNLLLTHCVGCYVPFIIADTLGHFAHSGGMS